MLEWSESGFSVPVSTFMAAMHFRAELICRVANGGGGRPVAHGRNVRDEGRGDGGERPFAASKMTGNMMSSDVAVMLHLRACYVSKAAILTVPVLLVPVENRSPA